MMHEPPEDFDPVDFALWRLECALADAAPDVSDLTREALVIARLRIEEERARRAA
jgi:hypothetical protein